jgi:creatinine amidohydrolase
MNIAAYAGLSWREIADLPRDTPMVIPLGLDAYDLARVRRLGAHATLVVLPAIPYGFPRRGGDPLGALAVGRGLFGRVLRGVRRELLRQGFTTILFLDAHGVRRWLGKAGVELVPAAASAPPASAWPEDIGRRVVVVSTAHTEQHGYHLPTGTDAIIGEAIARGVAEQASKDVVCLPTWPYGVSTHTRQFPGTLNLGGRVFEDFFLAIAARCVRLGARMIFFSNAHGGNHSYLVNIVKAAGERWPNVFTATEFLHTTGPALEQIRQSRRGGMGHGGELETSYLLHLRPDLVDMERATIETDFVSTPNYYMDWIEGGRLIANPPWTDDTRSGIYGDATLATAEKGRLWLEAAVAEKLESIAEIREQHERRTAKRQASWAPGGDKRVPPC